MVDRTWKFISVANLFEIPMRGEVVLDDARIRMEKNGVLVYRERAV